jgi:hypothetical protein
VFIKGLLLAKFEVLTAMLMIQVSGILRCVTGRLWHTFRWRVVTSYLGQILDPLSMKIDAKRPSKRSVTIYRSVRPNIPEDLNLYNYCFLVGFDFGRFFVS